MDNRDISNGYRSFFKTIITNFAVNNQFTNY